MDDCVKRDVALQHLKHRLYETAENNLGYICYAGDAFQEAALRLEKTWINEIPAADVKSIIHGRWEPDIEDVKWGSSLIKMKCSNCKNYAHFDTEAHKFILSNYCPNCGADMRKEKEHERSMY